MSILTTFFNLIKPAKTDGVKVSDFNDNMDIIDTEMHRPPLTVNGNLPDSTTRNIHIESVPLADNLSSDDAQFNQGEFLVRTSGGSAAVESGIASLSTIKGNMIKTGYVAEVIDMTVNAVTRTAPPAITAVIDDTVFESYVEEGGTYTLTYTTAWSASPALYGVTVSNTPVDGDEIVIFWDGTSDPVMTVNAVERPVPAAITATINNATFRAYVANSGTITLSYASGWSADPALYGITVNNTPISGDSIVIAYTKENRGTIIPANVTVFNSTGWNLYDNSTGYARVVHYSDDYGYKIGGNYSLVSFATTPTGSTSAVNVDADGYFNVASDGYVIVTGGDTSTYIYATWSDWTDSYEGSFEAYTVDSIDFSEVMVNFVGGLYAIGDVRDEINFNTQKAYSRIQRIAYTAENLATVISSGQPYDTDTNYIYVVRESPVEYSFAIDGTYTVSDHGIEFYTAATTTPPVTQTIYGDNLKDKLRTDVVTLSAQNLTSAQQTQVRTNIAAASASDVSSIGVIKSFSLSSSQKLLTVADNDSICPIGVSIINLSSGDSSDLPASNYKYGKAIVEKYATHRIFVTVRSIIDSTNVAFNRMDSSNAWLGWKTVVDNSNVYNGLDKTVAGFVLDARQGKKLIDRSTLQSIILRSSGTASASSSSVGTYNSRKFSDYWMIGFLMYSSSSDSIIRDVMWIDSSHWSSGSVVQTIANHGVNLGSVSGIQFSYNSDTAVTVVTIGAGSLTNFEIVGLLK